MLHLTGKSKQCQLQVSGLTGSRVSSCVPWVVSSLCFPSSLDSDYFTLALAADKLSSSGKTTLAACTHMLPIEQVQMNGDLKSISGRELSRRVIVGSPWAMCLLVAHSLWLGYNGWQSRVRVGILWADLRGRKRVGPLSHTVWVLSPSLQPNRIICCFSVSLTTL